MPELDNDVRVEMLVRLGALTGYMTGLAEAMTMLGVFDEWVVDIQREVKKTDELVQIWSSM
jgi:hypothetical protein